MVVRSTRPILYDSAGRLVRLGRELGSGGEGAVFELPDRPNYVAKRYHTNPNPQQAAKLLAMVRRRSEQLEEVAAWPRDILRDSSDGSVVGFIMPRITDFKPIHELYGPKSRLAAFPHADWRFLVHAGTNVARAFAVVHQHGHVIGDVNHNNIVVSDKGLIRLIDCDSFQVTSEGQQFLCPVGVSTHTPPELQGKNLSTIPRTTNHDAFGLAVVLFQLLCLGRHPFSGRFLGRGDLSLEQAIQQYRFAYSKDARSRLMERPPGSLPLAATSPPVADLFERAFSASSVRNGGRPTALEWVNALETLKKLLRECSRSRAHWYYRELPTCPWCEIEHRSGVRLFNISIPVVVTLTQFDVEAVWKQIQAVPDPGLAPPLPDRSTIVCEPSAQAVALGKVRRRRQVLLVCIATVIITVLAAMGLGVLWLMLIGATSLLGARRAATIGMTEVRKDARATLDEARKAWDSIEQRWAAEASPDRFRAALKELAAAKYRYSELEQERAARLRELETRQKEIQFQRFLESHRIDQASIPNIGEGRKATLQSWGIENAAQISESAILQVPGFGPVLTQNLLDWRRSVERRFRFDPKQGINPADVAAIDQDIARQRKPLERQLLGGVETLRQLRQQILTARSELMPLVQERLKELVQAETEWNAL